MTLRKKDRFLVYIVSNWRLIDLFSGAGGMTLGFVGTENGKLYESILAIDNDQAAIDTFNRNFGNHGICSDIEAWLTQMDVPQADIVIGGPPCQGFSLLNKKRQGDKRKSLWQPFLTIVQKSNAKVFVIENVRDLRSSPEYIEIKNVAEAMGFKVWGQVLNTADYGVPQTRHRTIIVGIQTGKNLQYSGPIQTHFPHNSTVNLPMLPGFDSNLSSPFSWRTVADAIGDLSEPVGTKIRTEEPPLDLHFGRTPTAESLQRYKAVPPGGNRFDLQKNAPEITPNCWLRKPTGSTDIFGRLWWNRPSVTIRTEFFKPEKGRYLHPTMHRPITHREAARLMSFPDTFVFCGKKIEIARQIGNAVPPLFATAIADSLKPILAAIYSYRAA